MLNVHIARINKELAKTLSPTLNLNAANVAIPELAAKKTIDRILNLAFIDLILIAKYRVRPGSLQVHFDALQPFFDDW